MYDKYTKLDNWVKQLIVDPLNKDPLSLSKDGNYLISSYGRSYPVIQGVYDLRLLNNEITNDQKLWKAGQFAYEKWNQKYLDRSTLQDFVSELEGVRDVYKDIPVEGDCLDVGGNIGRLRAFLQPDQKYISCDPFLDVFKRIDKQPHITDVYKFLPDKINFICCDAEYLPFKSCSFQTVHMRSVIDHFLNPELALNEAYRVLKNNGALIVGLSVHGGRHGKEKVKTKFREFVKRLLAISGMTQFEDHHVWHPTYKELIELIANCGFKIEKTHWQKGMDDTVCYVKATKSEGLTRKTE